jgi:dihydrofolate reductase
MDADLIGKGTCMTKVVADISASLDGFVTGPNPNLEHGLGRGGEALHDWVLQSSHPVDVGILEEALEGTGAVVMGRRLFDFVDGPHGWNEDMGYGAGKAASPPFFVVTHEAPDRVRLVELSFTFVTDGLKPAIEAARAAADPTDVVIMGGADVVRQSIDEGLAEEFRLHLAPILLGEGTQLFEGMQRRSLTQETALASPYATHLTYKVGT